MQRNLGARLAAARPLGPLHWRSILPSSRVLHRCLPGTLLAGDALRLVNPFTGEGLSYALSSGCRAGRTVANGLRLGWDDARMERVYRRALRRSLEPSLRVGDWVSRRGRPLLHLACRAACTRLGRRLISRALA